MSKKLAIMSGKGGSGKTSLSLAFSKALADSNLRVLLVDCDMSTHGATFFMKPNIERHRNERRPIVSVDDILLHRNLPPFGFFTSATNNIDVTNMNSYDKLIEVEPNFYFLPSDVSISNLKENNINYNYEGFDVCLGEELEDLFDVIVFDCQAGFSEITRHIIRKSDMCLLITEPDSVSAAANKALCFQLGIELQDVQVYQLFNKITEEEAKYYSKIATSAFFSNLTPVVFNWAVRKTFVLSQIPSTESVDFYFGKSVIEILLILFPEYKKNLLLHKDKIYETRNSMLDIQMRRIRFERKENLRKSISLLLIGLIPMLIAMIAVVVLSEFFIDSIMRRLSIAIIILSLAMVVSVVLINYISKRNKQKKTYERMNEFINNYYDENDEFLYDWEE